METLKVTFIKRKDDNDIFKPAYFNSRTQIVINPNDFISSLQLLQQQILNGIAVWLSEGSGWVINSIDEQYINTVVYDPLKRSSYVPLLTELQHSKKGLVNIKNEDNECFRWCHIRNLNPQRKAPQRIKKSDEEILLELYYEGIEFPVAVKDYSKLEWKNYININGFGYENKQFYPIYVSKEGNEDVLNLLLITKDEKKHVLIKVFNSLMFHKTKHEHRKHFCMHCLQCLGSKEILAEHKTNCMVTNGEQTIRMLEKGKSTSKFHNDHKQMSVPIVI